ncbi:MAG: DUF2513 domain-containing protein [Acidithiobacillus sp.]
MRVDYEYISKILDVFLNSERTTVDWNDFYPFHSESEDRFVFHIEILRDKGLVSGVRGSDNTLGINGIHGEYYISVVPWRLTADGHDFASAITKPSVLIAIKNKFKTEGIGAVIEIAKKIAVKQAEKLLDV